MTQTNAVLNAQPGAPPRDREIFWRFCCRTAARINCCYPETQGKFSAGDVDVMFVDQNYRCAVSGIPFDPPVTGSGRKPFCPSIDRIRPGTPYAVGNVRLVCMIVNLAMNKWGEEALHRLVREMRS